MARISSAGGRRSVKKKRLSPQPILPQASDARAGDLILPQHNTIGHCSQNLATRYGQPIAILSDEGSDIHGGFAAFGQDQPAPIRCRDIVHKMSRLIKKILDRCQKWQYVSNRVLRQR